MRYSGLKVITEGLVRQQGLGACLAQSGTEGRI